jgi:hypothetical protein
MMTQTISPELCKSSIKRKGASLRRSIKATGADNFIIKFTYFNHYMSALNRTIWITQWGLKLVLFEFWSQLVKIALVKQIMITFFHQKTRFG